VEALAVLRSIEDAKSDSECVRPDITTITKRIKHIKEKLAEKADPNIKSPAASPPSNGPTAASGT